MHQKSFAAESLVCTGLSPKCLNSKLTLLSRRLSCSCLHDRVTEYSGQNAEGVACSSCLIHLFHSWSSTSRRTLGTTGCESAEDETPRGSSHLKRKITTAKMNGIAAWQRYADVALEVPTAWQLAPHVHTQL